MTKTYINFKLIPKHLKIDNKRIKWLIKAKIRELKNYCHKFGFQKAIIGLSGGIDSAVAAILTAKALGAKNIIAALMPYWGISSKKDVADALKLARSLKIPTKNILIIAINKAVDASWKTVKKYRGGDIKIRKGNLMARERMKILFDLSSAIKAIVVGTENRSEEELGYYTLFGDEASGIEPLKNLWKTQIFQLASNFPEIPTNILAKMPSPNLWKGHSAEKELSVDYLETDIILSAALDLKMPRQRISKKFDFPQNNIEKVFAQMKIGRVKKFIPYVLKN